MSDFQHPGARNPKAVRFTVGISEELNARLEALADRAGQNKTTMAATALAAGISVFEPIFQLNIQKLVDAATDTRVGELVEDIKSLPEQK